MTRLKLTLLSAPVAALLVACGGTTTAENSSSPTAEISPSPAASAAPTSIDPCQLVTAEEASAMAGVTFGAGKPSASGSGNGQVCTYGGQTATVFMVVVTVAPDAQTAQADWAEEQARAQAQLQQEVSQLSGPGLSVNVNEVSVKGSDKAAVGTMNASFSGVTLNGTAIYALKGAIFFSFSDLALGHPAATAEAMQNQAATVIGRLP